MSHRGMFYIRMFILGMFYIRMFILGMFYIRKFILGMFYIRMFILYVWISVPTGLQCHWHVCGRMVSQFHHCISKQYFTAQFGSFLTNCFLKEHPYIERTLRVPVK